MFVLNLKKDWKMHKSLLISFFVISLVLLGLIFAFYLFIKYAGLSDFVSNILRNIWLIVAGLVMMLGGIFPIVIMFKVVKNDVGKNNVQYTIFTPQSLVSWYVPKVLFIFITQAVFGILTLVHTYLFLDALSQKKYNVSENIIGFLTETFRIGTFAFITLCIALYYSFRKRGKSWTLIALTAISYFVLTSLYGIISSIQQFNNENYVAPSTNEMLLINNGIDNAIGILFILLALYLFNKKVEY